MNQNKNVLIIDLGFGNIGSLYNALLRLNCKVSLFKEPPSQDITKQFTHVMLPGVGSFAFGMKSIKVNRWDIWLKKWSMNERPFLGICLGMQMMATYGNEGISNNEWIEGLNLIPGRILPLEKSKEIRLPHIGWNSISWQDNSNVLSRSLNLLGDYYFVHSYFFKPDCSATCIANCNYGIDFPAVIHKNNNYGVQFHPEKSQNLGKKLLSNFLSI